MDWSGESWPQFFFDSSHWRDFRIPYPIRPLNRIPLQQCSWTLMKVWDKEKIPETTLMRLWIRENNTFVYWLFSCRFRKGGARPLPRDCWLRWFNLSRRRIYDIPIAEVSKVCALWYLRCTYGEVCKFHGTWYILERLKLLEKVQAHPYQFCYQSNWFWIFSAIWKKPWI